MASRLPQVSKIWQINANVLAAKSESTLINNQNTLFTIKDILVNFNSNPWTIVRSSDSVGVADFDLWVDYSDIIWSTGNYSWIILQKPTTNSQILIDCERASSVDLRMYWSPDGLYTGGDITNKPTATDEVTLQSSGNWNGNLSSYSSWVHAWHTADGALTRIAVSSDQDDPTAFWVFDEVEAPLSSQWTNPEIVCIFEGNTSTERDIISASPVITNAAKGYDSNLGSSFDIVLGAMGNDSQAVAFPGSSWMTEQFYGEVKNELQTENGYPIAGVIVSSDTTGARGIHGKITDMWWGHDNRVLGTTFPNSTTIKRLAKLNQIVLPWFNDNTIPLFSPVVSSTVTDQQAVNNGTLTSMDLFSIVDDSPGGGFSIKSFAFDGASDYINMGNVLGFERTNEFSVSCWFKTSGNTIALAGKRDNSAPFRGYGLFINASGQVAVQISNTVATNYIEVNTSSTYNDNIWHHAAFTYDGLSLASGVTIYVDGYTGTETVVDNTLSATIVDATVDFQIGAFNTGLLFSGEIDDVAIYDIELTQDNITTIYNEGMPNDLTINGPIGNLSSFWLMGDENLVSDSEITADGSFIGVSLGNEAGKETVNYIMVGIDSGVPSGQYPAYHYWTVQGVPDSNGNRAGALEFGGPLVDINVSAQYTTVE